MSQPSRNHRPQRERDGGHYSERRDREPRSRRDDPIDRSSSERLDDILPVQINNNIHI